MKTSQPTSHLTWKQVACPAPGHETTATAQYCYVFNNGDNRYCPILLCIQQCRQPLLPNIAMYSTMETTTSAQYRYCIQQWRQPLLPIFLSIQQCSPKTTGTLFYYCQASRCKEHPF